MARLTVITLLVTLFKIIFSQAADFRFVFSLTSKGITAPNSSVDMFGITWATPGEITSSGLRMQFLTGRRNRQRYINFLSATYEPTEIYVRSVDNNSTLMSINAQLQGLYTPPIGPTLTPWQTQHAFPTIFQNFGGYNISDPAALPGQMQVFPTHTMSPGDIQYFYLYGYDICPPFYNVFASNTGDSSISTYFNTFQKLYAIQIKQAYPNIDISNYVNLQNFIRTFVTGYAEGFSYLQLQNIGVDLKSLNQSAYEFLKNDIYTYYNGDSTMYLPRLVFSSFWVDLQNWINTRITDDLNGTPSYTGFSKPKLALYSVDDVFIGSVMKYMQNSFNWTNAELPYATFASALNIELTRPNGRNAYTRSDYLITINFNDNILGPYQADQFMNLLSQNFWNQYDISLYCYGMPWVVSWVFHRATIGLGVLFCFFFLAFVITIIICCCCYTRKTGNGNIAVTEDKSKI